MDKGSFPCLPHRALPLLTSQALQCGGVQWKGGGERGGEGWRKGGEGVLDQNRKRWKGTLSVKVSGVER